MALTFLQTLDAITRLIINLQTIYQGLNGQQSGAHWLGDCIAYIARLLGS
ncbi:hypothetical protein ACUTR7_16065 [Delftia sp. NA_296.1]